MYNVNFEHEIVLIWQSFIHKYFRNYTPSNSFQLNFDGENQLFIFLFSILIYSFFTLIRLA